MVNDLSFGMYFLYTWCTREWCNPFGRNPNCRDSRINHMFGNAFPMRNNTPKPRRPGVRGVQPQLWYVLLVHVEYKRMVRRPGVRFTTSALVCTSCTCGVQENGSICLVVLQTVEILGLIICDCFW